MEIELHLLSSWWLWTVWYLSWELPLRSSPQAALWLILINVTVSCRPTPANAGQRQPTPCRPVSHFRVILITPSTSPQEFSVHFTPCCTSVSGFSAGCGLCTAERSASLCACVCLCVFAGASRQLELTCSKHGASHSYYITTFGWLFYDPLRTRFLQCDAHSDISRMRNRPPLTCAASFSIMSTRFNFRQSASLLPVSRQLAFRPEMMLWWRYGVFSRPPRLWITALDCKQLSPTAETNRYHARHSITIHLPRILFPELVPLHGKSFPCDWYLTSTCNCCGGRRAHTLKIMFSGFIRKTLCNYWT